MKKKLQCVNTDVLTFDLQTNKYVYILIKLEQKQKFDHDKYF